MEAGGRQLRLESLNSTGGHHWGQMDTYESNQDHDLTEQVSTTMDELRVESIPKRRLRMPHSLAQTE